MTLHPLLLDGTSISSINVQLRGFRRWFYWYSLYIEVVCVCVSELGFPKKRSGFPRFYCILRLAHIEYTSQSLFSNKQTKKQTNKQTNKQRQTRQKGSFDPVPSGCWWWIHLQSHANQQNESTWHKSTQISRVLFMMHDASWIEKRSGLQWWLASLQLHPSRRGRDGLNQANLDPEGGRWAEFKTVPNMGTWGAFLRPNGNWLVVEPIHLNILVKMEISPT